MLDHVGTHVVTDTVDVPVGFPLYPLHPVRALLTSTFGLSPPILTFQARQQTRHVLLRPRTGVPTG
jgi:hypothetical protein